MTASTGTERANPTTAPAAAPAPLGVLTRLFERLHEAEIRYCHWKSVEHLDAALSGATDVDVLFDGSQAAQLAGLLGACGFKRFLAGPGRGYPGIEDYVGFDHATATLTHLHVHYQLTLGEKFLKGHRLPWEERYLATRVRDARSGQYVVDPHLELIVLVVRQAMKLRARDRAAAAVGREFFRGGALREFRWLVERVSPERVTALAAELLGSRAAELIGRTLARGRPTTGQLAALRRAADPPFASHRLYGSWGAPLRAWLRELGQALRKLAAWRRRARPASTRTLPQGGRTIAVLGADGAGKSTVVDEIGRWLSREVAVIRTYGGSGIGSATLPRRIMQTLARWRRRLRGAGRGGPKRSPGAVSDQPLTAARAVWVLALARARRRRSAEARRARGLGMVVLSDRLAQSQFPGMNDGLRLTAWADHRSGWRRWAAARERAAFRLAELVPPDLVIKLHVPPDVALARKPETPRDQVLRGIQLVRDLRYPPTTRVVDLDATQPLAEVLRAAKRAVWEAL